MAGIKNIDWKALQEKVQNFQLDDLNDIDWENMGSWPVLGKIFFSILLFFGVLTAGYFFIVETNLTKLELVEKQESQLKRDFENKAFQGANLDAYKGQMLEMEESFGSLLKQLPRDTEVPGLVDDISSAALGAGLKLNGIDPQGLKKTEFYNELPIDIEVTGGYHEMGAFVSAVASLPRIVTLHDFSIEKQGKAGLLKMTIQAKTYQYDGGQ